MFELNSKQQEEFFERGFTIVHNLFPQDELKKMRESFDRLEQEARKIKTTQIHKGSYFVLGEKDAQTIIHRIVWCGACENYLLQVGGDERLVNPAAQLLGSRTMNQLINQAHFKLPGDGVEFPWHQDIQHRQKSPEDWRDMNGKGSYVQTLLSLDDMTLENGPIMLIPGSHKSGRIDFDSRPYEIPNGEKPVAAVVPAGSALFFGPYTVHGSFPNHSKESRRVLINGFAYPGANSRVYPGEGSGRLLKCSDKLAIKELRPVLSATASK